LAWDDVFGFISSKGERLADFAIQHWKIIAIIPFALILAWMLKHFGWF
jgi:hypothetical protein